MTFVGATGMLELRSGDVVLIPPGAWHYESYARPDQPYRFCWIVTTPGHLRCNFSTYRDGRLNVYWLRGEFQGEPYSGRCEALLDRTHRKGASAAVSTRRLVLDLLLEMQRHASALVEPPAQVEFAPLDKLVKLLETRFREPLKIQALASEVGLSPNYLSSRFRQMFQMTFTNYLNVLRVWHAQFLLEAGWPIKQIAAECGFRNVHYFTTVFKRKCRMTPGAYRLRALWGAG
jgi:AraC-like DNA-binding protein